MKPFAFGKPEKLKRRKHIELLFAEGRSLVQFPVRLKYRVAAKEAGARPVLAGVSVSRKNFKRAVDRNRLKRLLREAYRLQKADLVNTMAEKNGQLQLFLIYTDKTIASFDVVQEAVKKCLRQLQQKAQTVYENPD